MAEITRAPIAVTMFGVDPSCLGGISTLTRMLSTELSKCSNINFSYISTVNQGCALEKIACFSRALAAARGRFARVQGVVHIHMADNASVVRSCLLMRTAQLCKQTIVLHIHCDLAEIRSLSPGYMRKMIDWAILNSDRVITLGTYLEQLFCTLGYPRERVLVLPNAVFCPDSNPYTADRHKVLFLGNISEEKGVLDLLDALVLIDQTLDPDILVDLCGRDHANVRSEIEKRGLQHRVFYRGVVNPDEQFFSAYILNVLPSHQEALPFALLESSAQGIPSIATAVGSIPEIIDSGKSGWLVSVGDSEGLAAQLQYVLAHPDLLKAASSQTYQMVRRQHAIGVYIHRLLSLYRELVV